MSKRRAKLVLSEEEREELEALAKARKTPRRIWQRATIMLMYAQAMRVARIMEETGLTRPSVGRWIDRALALGAKAALKDTSHGAKAKISAEAKSWLVHVACTQPKTLGLAAEVWSRSLLAEHGGRHPCIGRDHEYKRHGTCSILAGMDLHNGHVFARVERRHRSREFILLLSEIDRAYPPSVSLRLILDNHSSHISKETKAWLGTRPNRFKFVHTPKHGSWLNLVETLFGKMSRTFLRNIRVASWEELRERILNGIAEINAAPVVHRWQQFAPLNND